MARKGKKLIETDDIIKAVKLNKLGGESAAKILMVLLGLNKLNKAYDELSDKEGIEFVHAILDKLEIKFEINEDELNRIPLNGPFLTVSNHPFGGLDGAILLNLILSRRPDFKILGNFLVRRVEQMQEFVLPVDPFESKKQSQASVAGIKSALSHLENGSPLGIFPAGEVSTYYPHAAGITDKKWPFPVLKFIKKTRVPIVPVYFEGSNSRLFHLLGLIHPSLRTAKLPSELMNKKNKVVRLKIGNPITVKEQDEFPDIWRYGRYLRAKTYALGEGLEVKKFFSPQEPRLPKEESVIDPQPLDRILEEINLLKKEYLLFDTQNYSVICAPSGNMPTLMTEIGRLREITFRAIGEGTNKKIDIDEFDIYYNQLFVWDNETNQIVGAYRVGLGKEIVSNYGINGFYIQTLFKVHSKFRHVLDQSLELGRSFIVQEYQRKPMPLFLLWKGILYFLIKNPDYRYLIGPVSISNRFSNFSKQVIIEFIKQHYYNAELARYIKPRNKFKVPVTHIDTEILFEQLNNIQKLDKLIEDIETNFRMPVLLKKYLQQNGKIVEFNIDPLFNECLDGLLVLDLFDVPMETISSLSKELNDETILDRFYCNDAYKSAGNPAKA
jgi:putative hemolysin